MGIFGLNRFETQKEKQERLNTYNLTIFPYGETQKEKIIEILKSLFPKINVQELTYNYIVTKEKITNTKIFDLNSDQLKELIKTLNKAYMGKVKNVFAYIVLAYLDLSVDEKLNYPTIEEIQTQIILLESKI